MDKRLVIQSGFNLMANGLPALFGLLSFRWLGGVLGVEIFGTYILFLAAFGIYTQIRSGIISAAFIRMTAGKDDIESIVGASIWISIILALVGVMITFIIVFFSDQFTLDYFILSLLAFTSIPSFIAINLNSARGVFQRVALIRLIETGGFLLLLITLTNDQSTLTEVLLLYALTSVITSIFIIAMNWVPRKLTFGKEQSDHVRAIWNFGKFTSGTQLVTSLLTNTDVFLINFFLGSSSVALYEYGRKWLEIFEVPFRSLAGVYFTEVSNMNNGNRGKEIWSFITQRALRTSFLSLLILPVVYYLAPFLIELISGTRESSSILVFRILSLLVLFIPFDRFLGLSLDVIGFPNINFKKGIILLVTNFLLDIVVIKLGYGIMGVATVSIIFYAVGTCLSFFFFFIKSIELFS